MPVPSPRLRLSTSEPACDSADRAWTIVVAGDASDDDGGRGQGGDPPVPPAYVRAGDLCSLLEQTLDRLGQLTPPSRVVTVVGPTHVELARGQARGRADHLLAQPLVRASGFGLYVALAMVRRWAPRAVVTITPVHPRVPLARTAIAHLAVARRLAALLADQVVVLGGRPVASERALPCVPAVAGVPPVRAAAGTAPPPATGHRWLLEQDGAPWCIVSACATVDALWELGRVTAPRLIDVLDALVPLIGTPDEDDAVDYIFRAHPSIDFTRDMLARAPWRCVTMPMDGSPARWEAVLDRQQRGLSPSARPARP